MTRPLKWLLGAVCLVAAVCLAAPASADGCYICGSGSSPHCANYCRYTGADTFANRKLCEKRGCKITGTASCPTAVNYKICRAPTRGPDTIPATWMLGH